MVFLSENFGKSGFEVTMLPISNIFKPAVGFSTRALPYVSKGLKNNNFKLLLSFFTAVILACSVFATSAWAYKPGTFPGVGSYAKWQEGVAIFEQAYSTKNTPEAIKLYQKAIDTYPYDATFWFGLGNLYTDKHKKIECFLKAAELNPDDCGGYQNAAYEYQHMGQYSKAIVYLKKAITITPNNSGFYVGLGECFVKLKKIDEAIDWLKKGYSITNNPDLLYDIGATYLDAGYYKLAKLYLEKCYKFKPNDKNLINALKEVNKKLHLNK